MQSGKHQDTTIIKCLNQQLFKKPGLKKTTDFTVHNNQTLLLQDWKPTALPSALQSKAATSDE